MLTTPKSVNNEPDRQSDVPKATFLNLLLKVVVGAIQWFIKRTMKKKEQEKVKLDGWKGGFVEKANNRIDRINLIKSVDKLCEKERRSNL
jgi:hypothetical protein